VPNGLSRGCKVFCFQVEVAKIVVHEADKPNAVVDLLMPSLWPATTVEMLILLRCRQRRPQARSLKCGTSEIAS
jgi:hypothetical protein